MKCSACDARLRDTARFCPYCGHQAFSRPASYAGPEPGGQYAPPPPAPNVEAPDQDLSTVETPPDSWPLPRGYAERLASGVKVEAIIWELIRHNIKMRRVMEGLVEKTPAEISSGVTETIKKYLQSHCVACGAQTARFAEGRTPVCKSCDDNSQPSL